MACTQGMGRAVWESRKRCGRPARAAWWLRHPLALAELPLYLCPSVVAAATALTPAAAAPQHLVVPGQAWLPDGRWCVAPCAPARLRLPPLEVLLGVALSCSSAVGAPLWCRPSAGGARRGGCRTYSRLRLALCSPAGGACGGGALLPCRQGAMPGCFSERCLSRVVSMARSPPQQGAHGAFDPEPGGPKQRAPALSCGTACRFGLRDACAALSCAKREVSGGAGPRLFCQFKRSLSPGPFLPGGAPADMAYAALQNNLLSFNGMICR